MSSKPPLQIDQDIKTILGPETVFRGTLRFRDSLKIFGRCEGVIESGGALVIGKGAEVLADIRVGSIIVAGTVKGNIEATEQTEMLATGKVFGNVRTSQLKMDDGVVFEGKVEMLKNSDSLDIFSATATQLKQSLETL
ncbi:MAG: polymer-forming cytoskeletal protein [Spirochaetales bacterium]